MWQQRQDVSFKDVATDDEVRGVEVLVGPFGSLLGGVLVFACLFVAVTQA